MGEVVDMTSRVAMADEHPLGAESVGHLSLENQHNLRAAWDEAPKLALYLADRHGLDYDDAVICLVHSLLREAEQCADRVDEAAFVLGFIGQSFYGLTYDDGDSSESS